MIEHCVTSLRKKNEELTYRTYVTDALKYMAENTAKNVNGVYMGKRYIDLIRKAPETATAAEIKARIKGKFGG